MCTFWVRTEQTKTQQQKKEEKKNHISKIKSRSRCVFARHFLFIFCVICFSLGCWSLMMEMVSGYLFMCESASFIFGCASFSFLFAPLFFWWSMFSPALPLHHGIRSIVPSLVRWHMDAVSFLLFSHRSFRIKSWRIFLCRTCWRGAYLAAERLTAFVAMSMTTIMTCVRAVCGCECACLNVY